VKKLEYIYSALLLHSVGQEINESNIKKVLESAGAKVDDVKIKALVAALEGVDIEETLKQAAMPVATTPATEEKKEEAAEEKQAEEEAKAAEEAVGGLASLFG
jgi:large subunit ribosomal protein L12